MYSILSKRIIDTASKRSSSLRRSIILLITILVPISTWAQIKSAGSAQNAVELSGIILDLNQGDALIGANIWISPKGEPEKVLQGFSTDANGRFRGIWSEAFAEGYADLDLNVSYVGYTSLHFPLETALQEIEKAKAATGDQRWVIRLQADNELEALLIKGVRSKSSDPVSQTTLSPVQLEQSYRGQQPIFLLEGLSPSVISFSESGTRMGNYGGMRLRGIAQERINMTLNGIPLNDMIDHGVFFSNFTDLGANFESVQIQRGVGIAPNGVASYAGSVNFETVRLQDRERGGEMNVGLGSFNTYRLSGSVSSGLIDDRWSLYGSYSSLQSDGFRDYTATNAYSFFFSGAYIGNRHLFKWNAFDARSKNGLGYLVATKSQIEADPRINLLDPNDKDDFGQRLVQFQHSMTIDQSSSLQSSLYYGGVGGDFFYTYDDGSGSLAQINYPLYNDHYGFMSTYFYEQEQWSLSTGVHAYRFNRINEESVTPNFEQAYYNEQSYKDELSWFGRAQWQADQLHVQADLQIRSMRLTVEPDYEFIGRPSEGDLRYDWTFINPRIGITFIHSPSLSSYASLGRMGREPTKVDIFGGFSLISENFESAANTSFGPEFVNNIEAGLRWNRSKMAVSGNLFYMDFVDEIAPIGQLLAFGVQKRENIASSARYGAELEWNTLLVSSLMPTGSPSRSSSLSWEGNLAWMRSQIDAFSTPDGQRYVDQEAILSPNWIINQALVLDALTRWGIRLEGRYVSESFMELTNNPSFVVPAYTLLNAQISWKGSRFDLGMDFNNLLDAQYYSTGSPVDVDFNGSMDEPGFLANAGRNIMLSTRFRF